MSYRTVLKTASAELIVKKSRFIAEAAPVYDDDEALGFVSSVRKKMPAANHHVFAYAVGGGRLRQSDDGEPQGTAGMPLLDMLRNEKIQNTVIVVTRFFGGTLLGTGGLVRAYTDAGKLALEQAVVIEKKVYQKFSVNCDYSLLGKIQYELARLGAVTDEIIYADRIDLYASTPAETFLILKKALMDATSARAAILEKGISFGALCGGKLLFFER